MGLDPWKSLILRVLLLFHIIAMPGQGVRDPGQKGGTPNPKQPIPTRDHLMQFKNGTSNPKKNSGVPPVNPSATPNRFLLAKQPKSPLVSFLRKNQVKANEVNRLLVTINVLGSAGPLRFLTREDETVHKIIETALKLYAREGRLPVLGDNTKQFELYCANSGTEAVEPCQVVGVLGTRNFLLCKKHDSKFENNPSAQQQQHHLKGNLWKSWWNTVSLSFGISSH